jgi:hypothetical protein
MRMTRMLRSADLHGFLKKIRENPRSFRIRVIRVLFLGLFELSSIFEQPIFYHGTYRELFEEARPDE